jgi:pyrroline-5-carboxylate reductase
LARWLGNYQRIVRAMPNTPALIGAGMAGLYAMPDVSDEERLHAERILNAVGDTLWVNLEEQLDGITAISGSGPAYVFLFIESLQKAAVNLGFSQEDANLLVMKTLLGSARLAEESDDSAEVLRLRVTSKGGTTEAALKLLGERGFQDTVLAAVEAAFLRSSDLGQFLGRD